MKLITNLALLVLIGFVFFTTGTFFANHFPVVSKFIMWLAGWIGGIIALRITVE